MAASVGSQENSGTRSSLQPALALVRSALDLAGDGQTRLKEILAELSEVLQKAESQLSCAARCSARTEAASQSSTRPSPLGSCFHFVAALSNGQSTCIGRKPPSIDTVVNSVLGRDRVKDILNGPDRPGQFRFDALKFCGMPEVGNVPIAVLGQHLLTTCNSDVLTAMQRHNRIADVGQFQNKLINFLGRIDRRYNANAVYHNSSHACDVMSTLFWFLQASFLNSGAFFNVTDLEMFIALVSAAIHDVGHAGRNNGFYLKTMDPLAIKYNDDSPLENMHISTSFEVLTGSEDCDWFHLLDAESKTYTRKGLISMVLATDPAKAMPRRDIFKECLQDDSKKVAEDPNKKLLLLGTMLHAADISNPTKPQHMMLAWVGRLLQEFWEQGDEERSLGLPISMLCDRDSERVQVPKGQLGFINFVIKPLYTIIVSAVDEAQEAMDQLASNVTFWKGKADVNATYEQIFDVEDEKEDDSLPKDR